MSKPLNIFFSEKPYPNKGKYEIFVNGKETGELITVSGIKKLLSRSQYLNFMEGEAIFMIAPELFKNRNNEPSPPPYNGKKCTM